MKTRKAFDLVEISYWTCAVPSHRHRTAEVAEACIEKKNSAPKEKPRRWTDEMLCDALESVLRGASWVEAGKHYGISTIQIRYIVIRAARVLRAKLWNHMNELCMRAGCDLDVFFAIEIEEMRANKELWFEMIAAYRKDAQVLTIEKIEEQERLADSTPPDSGTDAG